MVQTTEPGPTETTAVDAREQAYFMPRPDEPVTAYAERLRVLRTNLDRLIATVERGAEARETEVPAPSRPFAPQPVRPGRPAVVPRAPGPAPGPVEIITVAPERADRIAEDERRWAAERRQRLTERRIAPDRRVGRADTRSHAFERRGGVVDRRHSVMADRRTRDRRSPVITEPSPVLDPITWVWVF
jgi:hypothetical protein